MTYAIDYGDGVWTAVYPDGFGMHGERCQSDGGCSGCWDPVSDDPEVWFAAVEALGSAARAKVNDTVRVF